MPYPCKRHIYDKGGKGGTNQVKHLYVQFFSRGRLGVQLEL